MKPFIKKVIIVIDAVMSVIGCLGATLLLPLLLLILVVFGFYGWDQIFDYIGGIFK